MFFVNALKRRSTMLEPTAHWARQMFAQKVSGTQA
jgi:hypothetical protein